MMGRGLERRRIFATIADKTDFLNRLGLCLKEQKSECMACALMSNHYHLLIRVGDVPLSHLMRKLLSGYATNYNLRHKRSGYVFQNRYKSILCDADNDLLELVRYIHLNPIKAKLIQAMAQLDTYAWTGHAALVAKRQYDWQNVDEVLEFFSSRKATARVQYREFVKGGIDNKQDFSGGGLIRSYGGWQEIIKWQKHHEAKIGGERILGDSDYPCRVPTNAPLSN